jgi:hypothetical protein
MVFLLFAAPFATESCRRRLVDRPLSKHWLYLHTIFQFPPVRIFVNIEAARLEMATSLGRGYVQEKTARLVQLVPTSWSL